MKDERTVNVESNQSEVTNPGEWWRQVRSDLDQRMEALMVARLEPLRREMQQLQSMFQGLEQRIEHAGQPVWEEMEEAWRSMERAIASAREAQAEAHRTEVGAAVEAERKAAQARLAETEERLRSSREVLSRTLRSLEESSRLDELAKTAEAEEGQRVTLDAIQGAIESISLQSSQQEALLQLIDQVTRYAPRSIFFVVRAGQIIGWRVRGFENGLTDSTVTSLRGGIETGSILGESLRTQRAVAVSHPTANQMEAVLGSYSFPLPTRAVAIPLVVREKAVAVLYVDGSIAPEEEQIDQGAIELLLRVTSLVIELLSMRKQLVPTAPKSSTPAPPEQLPAESSRIEESAAMPAVKAESTPPSDRVETIPAGLMDPAPSSSSVPAALSPEVYEKRGDPPSVASEETPAWMAEATPAIEPSNRNDEVEQQIEANPDEEATEAAAKKELEARDETPPSPFSMSPEMGRITREIPAGEIPLLSEDPRETEKSEQEVRVHFPFTPSEGPSRNEAGSWDHGRNPRVEPAPTLNRPPAESLAGSSPAQDEIEQRAHNDARRFARLLVSEIKLYNTSKVQEGRRNLDLYDRLAEEIDRSRQVYDKRVSAEVAMEVDYYHEELVQTLAEGDPAKLGASYPGPALR